MKVQQLPTVLRHFCAAKWRWHTLRGERLTHYQNTRAQQIIDQARRRCSYYCTHWQQTTSGDWRTFPTIDKSVMMAHFAELNCYGIDAHTALAAARAAEDPTATPIPLCTSAGQAVIAGLSSGTSGERGLFLATEQEAAMWAGVILARTLHTVPWRGCRVAFFLRAFSHLYTGVNSPLLQLRYFALTDQLDQTIVTLNHYQPHIVIGPPCMLEQLARAQCDGALRIAPHRLIAVAEVLEPQDENDLHRVFGAPIHQIYQCTEGLLAVSCAHGSLHIQEDLVALDLEEVPSPSVDDVHRRGTGSRAPTVELPYYTPIITDLWRTTQPVIRYRLGDLLRVSAQPCPCGSAFRVITAIEGRLADLPYFTENSTGCRRPLFPALLRQTILGVSPAISDYQVVQAKDDHLQIYLATDPRADFGAIADQLNQLLTNTLLAHGCQHPVLTIHSGLPLRPAYSKRRRVQRERA